MLVSSGIEFDKYQTAKDEILAQLEAVKRGEVEDWELEGSRRTLIGNIRCPAPAFGRRRPPAPG